MRGTAADRGRRPGSSRWVERYDDPRGRLLAVFEAQGELFADPGFRGCAFVSASAGSPGEVMSRAADDYRGWVRGLHYGTGPRGRLLLTAEQAAVRAHPGPGPRDADTSAHDHPRHWPDFQTGEKLHCNVDRATVRQILLTGLEDVCHFSKHLVRYESGPGGITAVFADGTSAGADILVGADGIRSAVRHQRAPRAQTMDAGVQAIYGRIPFDRAAELVPAPAVEDIFAIASDARKVFLGLGR